MNERMAAIQREKDAEEARAREEMQARERAFHVSADNFWSTNPHIQSLVAAGRTQEAHELYDMVCDDLRKE
jgi:hypothetical protein